MGIKCSSETAKNTNFKFGRREPLSDSPDMTMTNVSEKWAWSGSRDPINIWCLNVNSYERDKDTNFKFGRRATRDCPDMTPDKCFRKVGVVRVK